MVFPRTNQRPPFRCQSCQAIRTIRRVNDHRCRCHARFSVGVVEHCPCTTNNEDSVAIPRLVFSRLRLPPAVQSRVNTICPDNGGKQRTIVPSSSVHRARVSSKRAVPADLRELVALIQSAEEQNRALLLSGVESQVLFGTTAVTRRDLSHTRDRVTFCNKLTTSSGSPSSLPSKHRDSFHSWGCQVSGM